MATQNTSALLETRPQYWRRVLRPVFWWLLLVLVLYGIRTHQLWMEKTRLNFSATLAGQTIFPEAMATVDGQPIMSGQKISLGSHIFTVTHPKGEAYSTNLHIWYGGQNLGTIDLKRAFGTLSVTADPAADWLVIRGPEWSVVLTNSSGLTKSLPTDQYEVEASYPHWRKIFAAGVFANQTTPCNIAPHFGGLNLKCNQSDATFQLQTADGQSFSDGLLPVTITGVPPGDYKIIALHHGNQRTGTLTVSAGATNDTQIDFQYGVAVIKTSPAGVTVVTENGRSLGETPLTLNEMVPGNWTFTLQRPGYQTLQVSLDLKANKTITISTNLLSETYLHALTAARQYMAAVDYEHALQAAEDALAARPGDADATMLQREATGLGDLQRAQAMGKKGDYIGGDKQLTAALQFLPDNAEIKGLLADFKLHEPAQLERERIERLNRPRKVFNDTLKNYPDAALFEEHELITSKPYDAIATAIARALKSGQPAFQITGNTSPQSETSVIEAAYEIEGFLGAGTTSGQRRCIIVCGQSKDDETQIYFKVLEYKAKTSIKFSIANILNTATTANVNYTAIHPTRIQMTDALQAQLTNG
ncbi:MAG: PEGA domain-containing protein, partial [Verrucomicrobiota bacterium]